MPTTVGTEPEPPSPPPPPDPDPVPTTVDPSDPAFFGVFRGGTCPSRESVAARARFQRGERYKTRCGSLVIRVRVLVRSQDSQGPRLSSWMSPH
jgi:hypothetical protein